MAIQRNIKGFRIIDPDKLLCSGLPNSKDLAEIKNVHGIDTVIDFSDRERKIVANWCKKNEVKYVKIPIDDEAVTASDYEKALKEMGIMTLAHCFSGKRRSASFCSIYRILNGAASIDNEIMNLKLRSGRISDPLIDIVQNFDYDKFKDRL